MNQNQTCIDRCVAIVQGKGGVGKTSLTSNLAALVAKAGLTVLAVDTDPQGNLGRDLGLPLDDGERLLEALRTGGEVPIIRGVREHFAGDGTAAGRLDVTPSGPSMFDLAALATARAARNGVTLTATFRQALSGVAGGYDLILVDTPPGEAAVVEAVLGVSSAVLIPTRADSASLDGLQVVAKRFVAARQTNPDLALAGVLLFAISVQGHKLGDRARARVEAILEQSAPVFTAQIRHSDTAAVDTRDHGLVVHELEGAAAKIQQDLILALRSKGPRPERLLCSDPSGLAEDHQNVAAELLGRLTEIEAERAGREVAV